MLSWLTYCISSSGISPVILWRTIGRINPRTLACPVSPPSTPVLGRKSSSRHPPPHFKYLNHDSVTFLPVWFLAVRVCLSNCLPDVHFWVKNVQRGCEPQSCRTGFCKQVNCGHAGWLCEAAQEGKECSRQSQDLGGSDQSPANTVCQATPWNGQACRRGVPSRSVPVTQHGNSALRACQQKCRHPLCQRVTRVPYVGTLCIWNVAQRLTTYLQLATALHCPSVLAAEAKLAWQHKRKGMHEWRRQRVIEWIMQSRNGWLSQELNAYMNAWTNRTEHVNKQTKQWVKKCVNAEMSEWMNAWMNGWTYGWTYEWMSECINNQRKHMNKWLIEWLTNFVRVSRSLAPCAHISWLLRPQTSLT